MAPLLDSEGEEIEGVTPREPTAVVPASAFAGLGLDSLQEALKVALQEEGWAGDEGDDLDFDFDLDEII